MNRTRVAEFDDVQHEYDLHVLGRHIAKEIKIKDSALRIVFNQVQIEAANETVAIAKMNPHTEADDIAKKQVSLEGYRHLTRIIQQYCTHADEMDAREENQNE